MEKELISVVRVLERMNLDYVVTGTYALKMLGVDISNHTPGDLDIRVSFDANHDALIKLMSNMFEGKGWKTGLDDMYAGSCLNMVRNNVKVNIIVVCYKAPFIELAVANESCHDTFIKVEPAMNAIKEKMKLNRPKDTEFMLSLFAELSRMVIPYRLGTKSDIGNLLDEPFLKKEANWGNLSLSYLKKNQKKY